MSTMIVTGGGLEPGDRFVINGDDAVYVVDSIDADGGVIFSKAGWFNRFIVLCRDTFPYLFIDFDPDAW